MKAISRIPHWRFDALAGFARAPIVAALADELLWFEHTEASVLGAVFRDRTDGDFGGAVFGRDRKKRFRWIGSSGFHRTLLRARTALLRRMEDLGSESEKTYEQGDEEGSPIDFFSLKEERSRLHPGFVKIVEDEGFSPAREIIEPMMRWYEDADGNFVQQFQTTGFNARIWELYLFAAFIEMRYHIDRTSATPDFACQGLLGEFFVEAVTVNPSIDESGKVVPPPPLDTAENRHAFVREYMPTRLARVLTGKLARRYWEQPHVVGKPLLFAVHDFQAPLYMLFSRDAVPLYLYGYDGDVVRKGDGPPEVVPRRIETHQWAKKRPVASGFFRLAGAENVSAVLFSNSATISKFDRMGLLAGFGSARVRLERRGWAVDKQPGGLERRPFRVSVNAPDYFESWVEGLEVYHNPNAKYPVTPDMFPGAAHYRLRPDGFIDAIVPEWHPLASTTRVSLDRQAGDSEGDTPPDPSGDQDRDLDG